MIDFAKKIKNSNKFREPAIYYGEHGCYTEHLSGTKEYTEYWDEQKDRCTYGYRAPDGDFITGYHYFYLNFCPILRLHRSETIDKKTGKLKKISEKKLGFPKFFDYDYYFFNYIDEAVEQNKFGAVAKARDRGYSYKQAAICACNYSMYPGSHSVICAADKKYIDGTLQKAWTILSFLDENTEWAQLRQAKDTDNHKRASYVVKMPDGKKVEMGSLSAIYGINVNKNPDALRGIRVKTIFFEEAGSNPVLIDAWQIAIPTMMHDGEALGLMCAIGTGSTDNTDTAGLKELFYNVEQHDVLGVPNIWDEGQADTLCGFYCPQYANMENVDENGELLYMDSDGNTKTKESLEYTLEERKRKLTGVTDSGIVDRWIIEHAICPMESFQELGENIFNKKTIQDQLVRLRTNKLLRNFKQVGDLIESDGQILWKQKQRGDITKYPLGADEDRTGSVVVWEHPKPMLPNGTYLIAIDPYDMDFGTSLGSVIVWKRFVEGEDYHSMIVAEFTGRPHSAEEFYEICRKLCLYYNARAMTENNNRGIYTYFLTKKCDYLLADQPDILDDIIKNSRVNRKKGIHMTDEIKRQGLLWLRDMLNEEYSQGHTNVDRVFSEPLLMELLAFNGIGKGKRNVDRVSAMIVLMVYLKDKERHMLKPAQQEERRRRMFDYTFYGSSSMQIDDGREEDVGAFSGITAYPAGGVMLDY